MYNTTFFSESCTIQCQNGGFPIKPLSGICKCKCPSGLKGDYCEQVEKSASNYQVAIIKKIINSVKFLFRSLNHICWSEGMK